MCILIGKRKYNEMISEERLRVSFENNSDGCGMSYAHNGKVYVEKFMEFEEFYNRLNELEKEIGLYDKNVLLHFRISTSGKIDLGNCHPFIVSDDYNVLRNLNSKTESELVMGHNGILHNYEPSKNANTNDTQRFIKEFIYPMYKENKNFLQNSFNRCLIEKEIGTNKVMFIDAEGEMYAIGKFITDEVDGNLYSNDTYLESIWGRYYTKYDTKYSYSYADDLWDYIDIKDYCDCKLDIEDFSDLISSMEIFDNGDVVYTVDNRIYKVDIYNKEDYCMDNDFNLYYINYDNFEINFIGEVLDIQYEKNIDNIYAKYGITTI